MNSYLVLNRQTQIKTNKNSDVLLKNLACQGISFYLTPSSRKIIDALVHLN